MSRQPDSAHVQSDHLSTIELVNVGAGPETVSLGTRAADAETDAIVLVLQRDYHCRQCRQQVQDIAARYDDFTAENALVVSVLPEPAERARDWQSSYDLPFPLVADPETVIGDSADQPTRFGVLGRAFDLVGRMPETIVFDTTDDGLDPVFVHRGTSYGDRPSIDELLEHVRHGEEDS